MDVSGPIAVTSPIPRAAWTEVWQSAPGAFPSQSPDWLRCVCEVGDWEDASRLYRTADGRRLVLPLVRRRLAGVVLSEQSLPDGWGPGGLLGEGGLYPEDVHLVMTDLARSQALRVQVRPDPTTASTWLEGVPMGVRALPRMFHSLDLSGDFDTVWRTRFRSDARNRVRKAERAAVVIVRENSGEMVRAFQRLYAKSVDRWARQDDRSVALARWRAMHREPPHKLATVAARMGDDCRMYTAFVADRPVAAIVVLWGATTAAYWRGAMDTELAGRTYANYLLHQTAIKEAADASHLAYHMGDSSPGSLALFKSRLGATEQHYFADRIERPPLTYLVRARRELRRALDVLPRR